MVRSVPPVLLGDVVTNQGVHGILSVDIDQICLRAIDPHDAELDVLQNVKAIIIFPIHVEKCLLARASAGKQRPHRRNTTSSPARLSCRAAEDPRRSIESSRSSFPSRYRA